MQRELAIYPQNRDDLLSCANEIGTIGGPARKDHRSLVSTQMERFNKTTIRRIDCVTIGSKKLRDDMDGHLPLPPLTVHLVSGDSEWDALRPEWNHLFDSVSSARAPLHFDWMRTWWTIYGPHYARSRGL